MILLQNQRRKKVPSLHKLAILKLLANHHLLKDIDNLSLYYHLIKPVLLKLTKQQLMNLELKDPKLIELTEEIWYELLIRKFPNCELSDETSRSRYLFLEREQDLKRRAAINKLRLHTRQLEMQKNSNQIEIINHIPQSSPTLAAAPKLQFKSSLLQKINKECTNKEKKFNHDIRFNQITSQKRSSPSQEPVERHKKLKATEFTKPTSTTSTTPTTTTANKAVTRTSSPSSSSSSIFIPRSRQTVFKDTPVPKKRKLQQTSKQQQKQNQQQQQQPSTRNLKKSSIFIALAR